MLINYNLIIYLFRYFTPNNKIVRDLWINVMLTNIFIYKTQAKVSNQDIEFINILTR